MMTSKDLYLSDFNQLGIMKGDKLLVSSDITRLCVNHNRLYKERLSLDDIINKLQQLVGEEGTILFPTYNWDFCNGITFDFYKTPCRTGALGTAALRRDDFQRTKHPIYSFAVWGKDTDTICAMTNTSSFSKDSPFAWLDDNKAKQLVIDVPKKTTDNGLGFTFAHYVEQMSGVPKYRYEKNFTAPYLDADGKLEQRTYSMYVRSYELETRNDFAPLHECLETLGIEKHFLINEINYYLIDLHAAVRPIMDDIINNRSRKFCIYKGQ